MPSFGLLIISGKPSPSEGKSDPQTFQPGITTIELGFTPVAEKGKNVDGDFSTSATRVLTSD
ncbi:hypothetical protein HQN64_24320 [Enterobacteriaceae bacterium BIT-l23]|uniref:hypothetical protein n=1 Tax=Jejubacter sp. L23 TaxID=3092086 RepID=UPI001584F975|nr:hypothetical protein [Enterobacteriaceae bacterium BIT-l23]